jgi:hypothetical protein
LSGVSSLGLAACNRGSAIVSAMIDKPELRRFPPPWSVDEQEACFTVRDANGQALAYVYFEDEPGLCKYNALS